MKKILVLFILVVSSLFFASGIQNLYFGNLHSHTGYSDGKETPEFAFSHASGVPQMDFHGVTDHGHYFEQVLPDGRDKFQAILESSVLKTSEDFLALGGFEWTATGWGHINIYNVNEWTDRNKSSDLPSLYSWIEDHNALAQFNHPVNTFGKFDDFKYDPIADQYINLIEVGNGSWAAGDTMSDEMFDAYKTALKKGWHLGATVGQDNHQANWGSGNDSRTAVYSTSLERADFFESLNSRKTYGTEDNDIKIKFSAREGTMGSITYDATAVTLSIEIEETSTDTISSVEIYSRNGLIKTIQVNSNIFSYEETFIPKTGYEYYFIRVLENDNQKAVTSPIWVQNSSGKYLLDPSLFPRDIKMGENIKGSFCLVNSKNETKDFLVSIKNKIGKVFIEKNYTLAPLSSVLADLEFSPEDEELFFYIDSVNFGNLNLKIRSRESLNILLDSTHENFGKDSRNLLKDEIEKNDNKISYLERMIRPDSFKNIDIFILPLPSSGGYFEKMKILMKPHFNIIKNYLLDGGVLLLLGNGEELSKEVMESYNEFLRTLGIPEYFGAPLSNELTEKTGITYMGIRELKGVTYSEYTIGNGKVIIFPGDPFTDEVLENNIEILEKFLY